MSDSAGAMRKHVPAPELPDFRLLKMGGFGLLVASLEGFFFFPSAVCTSVGFAQFVLFLGLLVAIHFPEESAGY